jgi:hypothetical protein
MQLCRRPAGRCRCFHYNLPTRARPGRRPRPSAATLRLMIASQEELDWRCYRLYGLCCRPTATVRPTSTTARGRARASAPSRSCWPAAWLRARRRPTWFERHGSTPITEIPSHWPEDYRQVVQRRIDLIERDRNIGLIERPSTSAAGTRRHGNRSGAGRAARLAAGPAGIASLLAAPGRRRHATPQLTSTSRLADVAGATPSSCRLAALYAGHADFRPEPSSSPTWSPRSRALPAGAALHRHRPAQTRPVGRHLGPAAARRRRRRRRQDPGAAQVPEARTS